MAASENIASGVCLFLLNEIKAAKGRTENGGNVNHRLCDRRRLPDLLFIN